MKRNLIIDGHCDTLSKALEDNLLLSNEKYSFNVNDVKEKSPYIQFLAAFIDPIYIKEKYGGFKRVNDILDKFYLEYKNNKEDIIIIKTREDLKELTRSNKLGIVLTVENGSAISSNLKNIDVLYNRGIRVMSVTWNEDNELGCGALTFNDTGLTDIGKSYIKKLNKKNIIIDVSHLSYKSFYDVVDITTKPIIATHSCVNILCNTTRNLKNEQIKEIAKLKGVIGVCFYSKFLTKEKNATVDDVVNHIEYIASLVGIDYVGLGSDFDGIYKEDLPIDLKGVKDIDIIFERMRKKGFKEEEIKKVASGNFLRILNNNLK